MTEIPLERLAPLQRQIFGGPRDPRLRRSSQKRRSSLAVLLSLSCIIVLTLAQSARLISLGPETSGPGDGDEGEDEEEEEKEEGRRKKEAKKLTD